MLPLRRNRCLLGGAVELAVDVGDFPNPPLPLPVLEMHDLIERPVKMIGNIGYLLMQAI